MGLRASLAFRKNEKDIRRGRVPEKYTRIVPFVTGKRVLEIGSAEGVLALLLAGAGKDVVGIELRQDRYAAALDLRERWRELGFEVDGCAFVCGDLREKLHLLDGIDTVVAVRSIYYLRDDLRRIFTEISRKVDEVVLCGNPNRWPRYQHLPERLGEWNYFASREGMRALLQASGYRVTHEVEAGDPIVVGRRDRSASLDDLGKGLAG